MRKLLCALTVILVSVNAISVCAAEKAVSSKAEFNPPSDKVLLGKIKTLPENTWMKLPPIKTVGEIGWCDSDYRRQGPRIRDYCNRMVWAPERKRALYCGAGHNIHPYNDVWEYDLAANTWICLYGVEWVFKGLPKNDEDKAVKMLKSRIMLKKGVITTVNGAPVRPAHTWWGLCYDPDKRRLVFWDAHKGLLFTPRKRIAKALGIEAGDPLLRGSGSGPGEAWVFTFDPATRKWGEVLTKAPKAYESSQLEYIPGQKALWLRSGATYLLPKGKTSEWKTLTKKGGPRSGALTAFDPESRAVVAVVGGATFVYSFVSSEWKKVHSKSPGAVVPSSVFCYDSNAKRFVLFTHVKKKGDTSKGPKLWLYDLKTNTWTDPSPKGDIPGGCLGYYDPARNVTVIYSNGRTWVYRCSKTAK